MKIVCVALALAVALPVAAQDKAPKKKQVAHKKPTPQQIRKFEDLEKKRQGKAR